MMLRVVCGIICNVEKIFIARRKPEKSLGCFWEFPGGKIEEGEMPDIALQRELKEELGMTVIVNGHFKTQIHHYEKFSIELIAYKCQFIESTFVMTDHDLFFWIDVKDLVNFTLAPADIPIAEELMRLEDRRHDL